MQICGLAKYNTPSKNFAASVTVVQDKCVHYCVKCKRTVKNDGIGAFHTKKCQNCHSKFSFKCKQCNKIFHSYTGINQHLKIDHTISKDVFNCPECDYKTNYVEYLTKHFRRKHFIETHKCPKCDGKYKNRNALKSHLLYCKKEPQFQCDHCSYKTKAKMILRRHIMQVHTTGTNIDCPQCGTTLKNKLSLRSHLTYCGKPPQHQCNSCHFKTKYEHDLRKHYELIHFNLQEKQTCPHCAKECKNKNSLSSHLRQCGKSSDLSCKYCSRLFKSKTVLTQHIIRLHSDDDAVSSKYKRVYLHCNDCTYKTKFKGDLVKHVNTHLEDNVEKCSKCKKQFKREYLKKHVIYCGKDALRCYCCHYKTFTKECLKRHIVNMHSKGNELDCSRCGRTCKNKIYLMAHLQRCGTSPHLQCDHCSYKTKYKYVLRKHIEKLHTKKRRKPQD